MSNELTKHTLRMTEYGYKSTISTDHCEIYLASEIDSVIAQLEADKAELVEALGLLLSSHRFQTSHNIVDDTPIEAMAHTLIQKHGAK